MIRQAKRTLRGWKHEFLAVWNRLNGFHRIVIGIGLSIVLVYEAQSQGLNPLEEKVSELRNQMETKGIPQRVVAPKDDDETQGNLLHKESMLSRVRRLEADVKKAEEQTGLKLAASDADANAAIVELATEFGLRVCDNRAGEATGTFYEMQGGFESIYRFFQSIEQAPYLWNLADVSIRLAAAEHNRQPGELINASSQLILRFTLQFHSYSGGQS